MALKAIGAGFGWTKPAFPAPHEKGMHAEMRRHLRGGVTPYEFGLERLRHIEILDATRSIGMARPAAAEGRPAVTDRCRDRLAALAAAIRWFGTRAVVRS